MCCTARDIKRTRPPWRAITSQRAEVLSDPGGQATRFDPDRFGQSLTISVLGSGLLDGTPIDLTQYRN